MSITCEDIVQNYQIDIANIRQRCTTLLNENNILVINYQNSVGIPETTFLTQFITNLDKYRGNIQLLLKTLLEFEQFKYYNQISD